MPYDITRTLAAGPVPLHNVAATIGALYSRGQRENTPGNGVAVELPAVLELLQAIADREITPQQARDAFAPFLEDIAAHHREMDRLAEYY